MAKFTLHDSYELDFQLLGLVTPLRDYRICWFLNKALNIGMKRMDALEVQMNDESVWVHFTRFGCFDPLNKYYVYLLANREANYLLLPELRQADYFLMISGTTLPHTWEKVLDKTRELAQIQLVLPIDPAEIKSSQNLIFDHDIIQ